VRLNRRAIYVVARPDQCGPDRARPRPMRSGSRCAARARSAHSVRSQASNPWFEGSPTRTRGAPAASILSHLRRPALVAELVAARQSHRGPRRHSSGRPARSDERSIGVDCPVRTALIQDRADDVNGSAIQPPRTGCPVGAELQRLLVLPSGSPNVCGLARPGSWTRFLDGHPDARRSASAVRRACPQRRKYGLPGDG